MVSVYSTFLVVLSGLLYLTYQSITTSLAQAEQEIKERQQAEAMVRTLNEELEEPIAKRTEELAQEIKERKQAQADLAALARTDSLTGLFSRHNFFELAEKEFSESIRYQRPLSLIMLDLDFFKGINDTYGHIVGDCVLTHIGKLLRQTIRESDTAARYGGEEFIMLLPETDSISAELFADRLREIAADSPVQCESDRIHITISIGVAGKNSDDKVATLNKLISKTDQALYQAKRAGKNLVVVYSE
jgi:diguanylate cyclase (GGDEF)-like protein